MIHLYCASTYQMIFVDSALSIIQRNVCDECGFTMVNQTGGRDNWSIPS